MRTWIALALTLLVGAGFGYLVSEKLSADARILELTEQLAKQQAVPALPAPAALPQRAVPPAQRRLTDVSIEGAPVRGPADATITIVEFSDFQCAYCSRVHPTLKRLLSTYPQSIRLVFKHNPLPMHPEAQLAHRASIAASEQGQFWEMHDMIFGNIRDLSRATLIAYADELDLDLAKFTSDMDSDEVSTRLQRDIAESERLGMNGTPMFLINGKVVAGAQPFENFQVLVERELARIGS